ncbi:uncharacterized protein N7496_003664 [Penicillium cataractarum]|uniref:RapZ C-terminal domain-containing protein n=1 Tax=Penicillium cataractarum TaxID=2100454 RepID=A0A9W9VJ16_9EURO|nr:uncharacterized protein N7496_003664 [Penicillium cataractarum]KAJ5381236.1 hypothetical protein N7496_003664 [Penicillium cataractarum]
MSSEAMAVASPSTWIPSVIVSLFSYGHANGPIVRQHLHNKPHIHKTLAYNIRHLPNPPRHLRANATGLSRRLQKEFLQNDNVQAFLVKVQNELLDAIRECEQPLSLNESTTHEAEDVGVGSDLAEEATLKDADIDVVVTICCEEGRHRSVAFVEELARRLTTFKNGDGSSQYWKLNVNVTHRDIGDPQDDLEQSSGQQKRPNKAQAKFRQRERREKGERFRSRLEDDDGEE